MPTATFNRLNQKKKSRFIEQAFKEFAINAYQGGSITNLVKTLGIAKGSVYQYFEDKEALYRFLVEEIMQQLNSLLDKTCTYENEEFFTWYNKLLIVKLKYLLSFPGQAALLRNVMTGTLGIDRALRKEIIASLQSRIRLAMPQGINNEVNLYLLSHAPLQVFDLVTNKLNLAKIISTDDPIYLEARELMSVCSEWVTRFKHGL